MESVKTKIRNYMSKKTKIKKTKTNGDILEHSVKSVPPPKVSFDIQPPPERKFKSENERKKWEDKQYKVKPYGYYKSRPYMSEKEIHNEMLKPSLFVEHCATSFSDSKTGENECLSCSEIYDRFGVKKTEKDGRIGSLLVEVLGCVSLPKPNTFVYLLCGDGAFSTDIISSCRSPKWPCRSRRAALFPIHHAFVRLYVGVFNVEEKKTVNDKFAGRIVVDLCVLKPHTVYDVTLPLRESANVYSCKPRGVIRLRFHLHWCDEKAAVTSYLQRPAKNIAISCADPKTFRNVAYTLYGRHLPGKYSTSSFQSTMREMNLYKLQMQYVVIKLLLSFIVYEKPHISGYIFISWMLTSYFSAPAMIPSILVGLIILLLLSNYNTANNDANGGYDSFKLTELFLSLLIGAKSPKDVSTMEPILVHKKITPKLQNISTKSLDETCNEVDHAEFAFSERNTYPKVSITKALFPKKYTKPNQALPEREMNRLSIYHKSMKMNNEWSEVLIHSNPDEKSDSEEEYFSFDEEMVDEDLYNSSKNLSQSTSPLNSACQQMLSKMQSIPVGPEQSADKRTTSIPFKVTLKKMERFTNKMTFGLFDQVNLHVVKNPTSDPFIRSDKHSPAAFYDPNITIHNTNDDFERLLGLRQIGAEEKSNKNPVQRIMMKMKSDYQGPVMRIINTGLVMTRIIVNLFIWKDPILSFWFLLFLILLMFILAFFPWKQFMILLGLVAFGPQNMLLKKKILKRILKSSSSTSLEKQNRVELDNNHIFYGQHKNETSTLETRQVYVPYTPFRRDRFYDWPPNPAVSRATPLNFSNIADSTDEIKRNMMESALSYDEHSKAVAQSI